METWQRGEYMYVLKLYRSTHLKPPYPLVIFYPLTRARHTNGPHAQTDKVLPGTKLATVRALLNTSAASRPTLQAAVPPSPKASAEAPMSTFGLLNAFAGCPVLRKWGREGASEGETHALLTRESHAAARRTSYAAC